MTEKMELRKELKLMKTRRELAEKENAIVCGGPKLKRTYSYRKTPAIKAHDVAI